jgi:catechol 2,3-dioxygenase-like lactoylglutathione lyase family enzyme
MNIVTEFLNITPMLKTNDVLDTVEFYTQVLGFTVDTLWPADEPELCILDREDVHLMFDVNADWDAPGARPHLSGQLLIDVADVLALHAAVKDEVEILWGPEVYEYGRREFSIMDPNGYRLVFSEPTTDPPTCEG